MQTKIHTQGMNLNPHLEEKVNHTVEKLSHLADRISDESSEVKVDLIHEESRAKEDAFVCHITLFVPRETLRAEAHSDNIETAIDDVEGKLRGQIEHYKSKLHHMGDRK